MCFVFVISAVTTTATSLQVTQHFLTLSPSAEQVTVVTQSNCPITVESILSYRRCEGELNGTYTWVQENSETNYVLFDLNRRARVTQINVTYMAETGEPKVSFCTVPDGTTITSAFNNLDCREFPIQQTGIMIIVTSLDNPFNNATSKVAMEVITRGIKTDFVTSRIEFFGSYESTGIVAHENSYKCKPKRYNRLSLPEVS